MIRSLLRTVSRLMAAVMLFGLLLCAVEVWFRWERMTAKDTETSTDSLQDVILPDAITWFAVAPVVDRPMTVGAQELARLRTNEFGVRGGEVKVPKPNGVYRILCLGGANVFGIGQKEEETIPAELQKLFHETGINHVEFVNAGCPGSGPLLNYLRLRARLVALEPDLILYCMTPDDLSLDFDVRGGLSLDSAGLPAFATHPALNGANSEHLDRVCREFATADWIVERVGPYLGISGEAPLNVTPDLASEEVRFGSLVLLWRLCREHHCQLMYSLVPSAWIVEPRSEVPSSRPIDAFERDLHRIFSEQGIQSTSLVHHPQALFEQADQRDEFFDQGNGQLTRLGNMMYARTIAKTMVDFFPEILQKNESPQGSPSGPGLIPLNTNTSRHPPALSQNSWEAERSKQ